MERGRAATVQDREDTAVMCERRETTGLGLETLRGASAPCVRQGLAETECSGRASVRVGGFTYCTRHGTVELVHQIRVALFVARHLGGEE